MTENNIALIGGTGFEQLAQDIFAEPVDVTVESSSVKVLSVSNNYVEPDKLYFLSRHGEDHSVAPHQIDYRANILALKQLGVQAVFATNAVGSLNSTMQPGDLVLFSDFIDFTRGRRLTLWDQDEPWQHTDFTQPYSKALREAVLLAAQEVGAEIHPASVYVCVDGPRFESPAEIRMFAAMGGDVVGMTGLPEAVFAREAGMAYCGVGIVTNPGAGLSDAPVCHEAVSALMAQKIHVVRELLLQACRFSRLPQES